MTTVPKFGNIWRNINGIWRAICFFWDYRCQKRFLTPIERMAAYLETFWRHLKKQIDFVIWRNFPEIPNRSRNTWFNESKFIERYRSQTIRYIELYQNMVDAKGKNMSPKYIWRHLVIKKLLSESEGIF